MLNMIDFRSVLSLVVVFPLIYVVADLLQAIK
jgi:hypothetical protein